MPRPVPWHDTRTPASRCPFCGYLLDTAGSPDGKQPEPGDLSICLSCASPLVFEHELTIRAMTPAEQLGLKDEERAELERFQTAVRLIDRRKLKG